MKKNSVYACLIGLATLLFTACNGPENSGSNGEKAGAPLKMGLALYSFNNIPFAAAIEKIDSGKIKYIEGFSFYKLGEGYGDSTMGSLSKEGIRKMKDLMQQRQVKMVSMFVGGGNNLEEWKQTFEMAKEFDLEFVTCEPVITQLDMIDSLAGVYNIKVAIHNHWKGISVYWNPDTLLSIIKTHKNLGACGDLGHWVRSGLDPAKCLEILQGHIMGLHLKDVDQIGKAEATADVPVGTGVVDFTKVVAELKRQEFKGVVSIECEFNFGENLSAIVNSINYMDELSADKTSDK
ncbi:sugar phosphate isomerase/epimerase [Chitinophaga sp. MM2321]|uniref:sugar phosphate isomerase/epimerase family protein n=1 Tax=Chitinophaga sp. MM2321 TaxID=3137178 RepID=UPI0032D578C0